MENATAVPQKMKNRALPYNLAIPLLGIYPKEQKNGVLKKYLYTLFHSSIIHDN